MRTCKAYRRYSIMNCKAQSARFMVSHWRMSGMLSDTHWNSFKLQTEGAFPFCFQWWMCFMFSNDPLRGLG